MGPQQDRQSRGAAGRVRSWAVILASAPVMLLFLSSPAVAHEGWTGGVAFHDVVSAVVAGGALAVGLAGLVYLHRRGRTRLLAAASQLAEDISATPGWVAVPALIAAGGLLIACFGFYWDVATHMDRGRDIGPFANPSHYPILAGLVLLVVAGVVAVALGREDDHPTGVRLTSRWTAPLGGLLLVACGAAAIVGFPLDDLWHRIFGQDVTLWGPTHVLMVAGASLTTLALWVLYAELDHSPRVRPEAPWRRLVFVRLPEIAIAGAFLVGLSTLQAEFDYGFPQFRLVLQPVLIMLAAGVGLTVARIRLGRGGALLAALFYLAVRGVLSVAVGPTLGHLTLHAPLYLAEAVLVELVALAVPRHRQVTLGLASGLAIGTAGLAAEWAWTHVWMPIPWTPALLPEAALLGLPAAVAGGTLGGLIGRALAPPDVTRQQVPTRTLAALAGAVAVLVVAIPLPRGGLASVLGREATGEVTLEELRAGPVRLAHATVRVDPPAAARDAEWFTAIAWQGATVDDRTSVLSRLEPDGTGAWRTTEPLPVGGEWKVMIRLHRDRAMVSLPVHLPADPVLDLPGIPAREHIQRPFVPETTLLERAARQVPPWVSRVAYGLLGLIAGAWILAFAWGLEHLRRRSDELRIASSAIGSWAVNDRGRTTIRASGDRRPRPALRQGSGPDPARPRGRGPRGAPGPSRGPRAPG